MGVLRILLALSVVTSHGSAILGSTLYPGGVAVQIFFMISGFYMALVLGERYGLGPRGLMLFYSNRALRLFPAFLAVTLGLWAMFFLTWIVIGHVPGNTWVEAYATMPWYVKLSLIVTNWSLVGTDIFSNCYYSAAEGVRFTFPSNPPAEIESGMTWMHSYRTLGAAWSIGTEIWFYLLVPFLVRFRWFWLAGLFLLSLSSRLWIEYSLGRYPYFFFPAQLLFFIMGIWACQLYRRWKLDVAGAGSKVWPRLLVGLNWALVCFYPWYGEHVPQPLLFLIVAASLPWMFACTKNNRRDRLIGDVSYPLYLLHLPVQGLLAHHAGIHDGTLIATACIISAILVVIVVERPFERLRRARVARSILPLVS
jgi:peptidoglycan/LPS O-acetylase OafA/YrhL